jgi:hypothetical protein
VPVATPSDYIVEVEPIRHPNQSKGHERMVMMYEKRAELSIRAEPNPPLVDIAFASLKIGQKDT